MEALFVLLAVALAALVVLAPIFAILALSKTRGLEARLKRVEQKLREAEAQVARPESPRTVTPVAPVTPQALPFERLPFERLPVEPVREERRAPQTPAVTTSSPSAPAAESTTPATTASSSASADRPTPTPTASLSLPAPTTPPRTPVHEHATPAPKPRPAIQWEQWIGIRGAALVGGILLALAGLLFFKHALDRGWITPAMRVVTGLVVGSGAIGVGEFFRRRKFDFAPSATAGGGVVVLYATVWASFKLYGFAPAGVALPLMALVTGLCAWLSVRFNSQVVAVLGLVGGFATPLLISTESDSPLGLMGYLLLLDLGLLALGQRMKWPVLGLLGVLGSYGVLLVWMLVSGNSGFSPLVLTSLGAFALVFALAGMRGGGSQRRTWLASQAGALLLPFAFTTYFASVTDFGEALWPSSLLVGFLAVGASWVGKRQNANWLATGAAAGALSLTGIWLARTGVDTGAIWEFAACTLGLGAVFLVADAWLGRDREREKNAAPVAGAVASLGFALMTTLAAVFTRDVSSWPWLAAALGHGLMLHWHGRTPSAGVLRVVGASLAGLTLALHLFELRLTNEGGEFASGWAMAWMFASSLGWTALAAWSARREDAKASAWAWRAATVFPCLLLVVSPAGDRLFGSSQLVTLALMTGLAGLAVLPAMMRGRAVWFAVPLGLFLLRRTAWIAAARHASTPGEIDASLVWWELGACLLLAAAPLSSRLRLGGTRWAWATSAIAMVAVLVNADRLLELHVNSMHLWPTAAGAALGTSVLAAGARVRLGDMGANRDAALRWLLGATIVLASLAFARYWHHDVFIVAGALASLGLAFLWRGLPSFGLKLASVGLLAIGCGFLGLRLLFGFGGQHHFTSAGPLVWNWTSYATGLPTLCALGGAVMFAGRERSLLTGFELRAPINGRAWAATVLGLATSLLAFVWINLQVLVQFEEGEFLKFELTNSPARDLTLSICWILYAMGLLGAGMARGLSALRKISLVFLLLTLVKVFLLDLGDLRGLHRVGSLLGLAVSLLLVSLLYQRFVFPRRGADEDEEPESSAN